MSAEVVEGFWGSEQVITCADRATGLRGVIAIDNTTLGPGFGGTRWRPYGSLAAAAQEAQRLAAAMTLKHAVAELPYGGAKSVIAGDPRLLSDAERRAHVEAFATFVARTAGTYIPGVDMGTTLQDMQVIGEQARAFCDDVDPGPYTAQGVYVAMRAAVRHRLSSGMAGVRVLVQGVGHVGEHVARRAAADGAEVQVVDLDPQRAAEVAERIGGRVADPVDALTADVDVFAPCAAARVLSADVVLQLRARVVAGAANDTLDSPDVAQLLSDAGVVFVPDFVANAGGVIQVHAEQVGWSAAELDARLERIGDVVGAILAEADAERVTPVAAAIARAQRQLDCARSAATR